MQGRGYSFSLSCVLFVALVLERQHCFPQKSGLDRARLASSSGRCWSVMGRVTRAIFLILTLTEHHIGPVHEAKHELKHGLIRGRLTRVEHFSSSELSDSSSCDKFYKRSNTSHVVVVIFLKFQCCFVPIYLFMSDGVPQL